MGALAPISPWIPEDDLLLKNAVEAGASLESLAKGAVQFSRRYTVRELEERWHSLLYDPVISAEAAARMVELAATSFPSKASRCGNAKDNACLPGKRKTESVRSCYYAMRKRICNEPFHSMDLSFLVAQDDNNCLENGYEPLSENCMLGDPISNHFGFQEPTMETMHHSFPQIMVDDTAASSVAGTANAYHSGLQSRGENGFPAEQSIVQEDIPHVLEENQCLVGICSRVEELGQPKELLMCNMYEADNLDANPPSSFDQINNNAENVCSGFGGSQVFNSPISDCGASFQNLGYSSPLPEMPIWRTIEGISDPNVPVDVFPAEKDNADGKNTSSLRYDIGHLDFELNDQIPCDEVKCPSTEGYLEELSNSLLDFSNDDELFLDVDGKDVIDKSYYDGLSSLLLNSPSDANHDHMPNTTDADLYLALTDGAYSGEPNDLGGPHPGGHLVGISEVQMLSSTSSLNSQNPELRDGVICCVLNTEDPEIPSNEDVILPNQMLPPLPTTAQRKFHDVKNQPCSFLKDLSDNQKPSESISGLMSRERKNLGQSQFLPRTGLDRQISGCGVQFEFPKGEAVHAVSRGAGLAFGGPSQTKSANVSTKAVLHNSLEEECLEAELERHLNYNSNDSFQGKLSNGSKSFKSQPWTNASSSKQESDVGATIQNHQGLHAELGSIDVDLGETVVNPSISDQEEEPFEGDEDLPYFSDIEAMILDMDLGPDNKDIYFNKQVSRYQHEDAKRTIIRLEQSAHATTQRAIASHGAFAVLYGRHSKHYIKHSEILLGRATEDATVDIDLGREGCANKISRRQALIKVDDLGTFYLKNLAKSSIFVNNNVVAYDQSRRLSSGCVIEIRGMPFIFEANQTCLKQFVDNINSSSQTQEHKL